MKIKLLATSNGWRGMELRFLARSAIRAGWKTGKYTGFRYFRWERIPKRLVHLEFRIGRIGLAFATGLYV